VTVSVVSNLGILKEVMGVHQLFSLYEKVSTEDVLKYYTRQAMLHINVTLRHVRITIVGVEKQ
jgi:hypothetical protein